MTLQPVLTPLEITAWGFGALALLTALWLLTFYRSRIASVGAAIRRQTAEPFNPSPKPAPPAVSVVVVAGDHAEALESLLAKVFEQEYPSEMEVIVVNDGKNDDVKDVVTRIKTLQHRNNIFITFIPENLHNVSRRKLALTLGVKAAHYPVIIALTEESKLYSTQWLLKMAQPFTNPEVEVVVGSALPATKFDSGYGRRYRSFTHGHDAVRWLSSALRGKTFRAHRANMAFRAESFFRVGGMGGALNLRNGDDDIFISKIARPGNTVAVIAAQAAVRYAHPTSRQEFRVVRSARMFTERGLNTPRLFFGFSSLAAWLLLLASAGAIALGVMLGDWVITGSVAALFVVSVVILSITWRSTLKALRCRPAALGVFPMMLRRPLTNAVHRMRCRHNKTDYYTWGA